MSKRTGPSSRGAPDSAARAAIAASHLRSLPPEVLQALTAGASRRRTPAGSTFHREGDTAAHLELVVTGLVRIYVTVPDGRLMTVRYCRPGSLIGAVSLFAPRFVLPATIQAVTDADLMVFRPSPAREAAERDPRLASAMLHELSERVLSFITEIPHGFATVRQRVARHLLDLASERQQGSELVAAVGQQELADAVGTVREVVVRTLRELRDEGLIRTGRRRIVLLEPDRLAAEAATAAAATGPPGT
ncbi:MAG TPA: Crp/Fnr family transcriptional regulator [Trueperaceae bacterium]|nr:Crp/Fnr family transcriptional regulator [Trueperaceae bacterium]